ncbi:hypothetical protein JHK84_034547 [Glycine max]|nr:hypothetical protein JHK85_034922 [Glycine max]KAG4986586.1 hypothetical protein JHK86_034277 [Glycine max]KAG5140779.1 hypothetical protein JHK84_034547 [Glycine max]
MIAEVNSIKSAFCHIRKRLVAFLDKAHFFFIISFKQRKLLQTLTEESQWDNQSTVNSNYSSFGVLFDPNSVTEPFPDPQAFDSDSDLEEDNIFSFIHRIEQFITTLEISPRKEAKDWEKRTALASKLTLVVLPYHNGLVDMKRICDSISCKKEGQTRKGQQVRPATSLTFWYRREELVPVTRCSHHRYRDTGEVMGFSDLSSVGEVNTINGHFWLVTLSSWLACVHKVHTEPHFRSC